MKKIENIRRDYTLNSLSKSDLHYSPIIQFKRWFKDVFSEIIDPTAMTLSTYGKQDGVQSRVVLLKEIKKTGFVFYTNYNSLKSKQIELNNSVSLSFFWAKFQQQIRVNGFAVKLSERESAKYFQKRPRKSQIASCVSEQSKILDNREEMNLKFKSLDKKFKNKSIPKPKHWGGYLVKPISVEFWQGRENRMHDRFLYVKKNNKWVINRLFP